MNRYLAMFGAALGTTLVLFLIAEALDVPLLTDPAPWLERGGPIAAIIGVGLLVVDIVLPVPSSLVMVAHGAMFGVAGGATLSLIGSMGSAMTGYALGRRSDRLLSRHVSEAERRRADDLLRQWGLLAIIVTRPVPMLAESTAFMAGMSSLGWRRVLLGAAVGSLPAALLYAITGALATSVESGFIVFGLVLAIAGGVWLAARRLARTSGTPGGTGGPLILPSEEVDEPGHTRAAPHTQESPQSRGPLDSATGNPPDVSPTPPLT